MNYLSICSGIEAASVAWHPLGWKPFAFSEIEPFPFAVLTHHWPDVPNLGDMTKFDEWGNLHEVDLLVGGTPCQAFSVAGLRKSLDDARGNLSLTYISILNKIDHERSIRLLPPAVCVWENVPGVLNTKDNAFGCFLGGLAGEELPLIPPGGRWSNAGYVRGPQRTVAWRILDAQYLGVVQRRRRVFVVASARDGFCPEQILFEFDSVRRDSPPSREARKEIAASAGTGFTSGSFGAYGEGVGTLRSMGGDLGGGSETLVVPCFWNGEQVTQTLDAVLAKGQTMPEKNRFPAVLVPTPDALCARESGQGYWMEDEVAIPIQDGRGIEKGQNGLGIGSESDPAYTLDQTGAQAVCAIQGTVIGRSDLAGPQGSGADITGKMFTLTKTDVHAVAFSEGYFRCGSGHAPNEELANTLQCNTGDQRISVAHNFSVRRLTPTECARLQGFQDDHCKIPWRSKAAEDCPDGPQYKAYGNSMAVPCVRWIGERIDAYLFGGFEV